MNVMYSLLFHHNMEEEGLILAKQHLHMHHQKDLNLGVLLIFHKLVL